MRRISLPGLRAAPVRPPETPPLAASRGSLVAELRERSPRPVDPGALAHWSGFLDRLDAPEPVRANFRRLQDGAFVVVTGQQAGALTGPLLTVLKAARAVSLARDLETRSGRPVVPVFWVAADDHDLGEIHHADLLGKGGELHRFRVDLTSSRQAASEVSVPPDTSALLAGLATEGLLDPELVALLAPDAGDTMSTWFSRCLMLLLGPAGLVPVEPEFFAAAGRDLFERVLDEPDRYDSALRQGGRLFDGAGLAAPLEPDGDPPLFVIGKAGRHRVRREAGHWTVQGRAMTRAELGALAAPGLPRLSANVSLRTLLQDHVLPVTAYVAGPAEEAYWAQLRVLHEDFDVPYPLVVPRAEATVVPSRAARMASRLGGSWSELLEGPGPVEPPAAAWEARGQHLALELAGFLEEVFAAGPAFASALSRRGEQLRRNLQLVLERAAELHREGSARGAARRSGLLDLLRPRGKPQERVVNVFSFWSEFGAALVDEFLDLPLDTETHWLILAENPSDG